MKITINTDNHFAETEISINCSKMSEDIEKLISAIRMLDKKITGQKEGRQHIIDVAEINYIESVDKRTFLYTSVDVYECSLKLYELEAKLSGGDFLRASKNCLFNMNRILSIEADLDRRLILTMEHDIKLGVSRQYAAAVKQKLEAYNE